MVGCEEVHRQAIAVAPHPTPVAPHEWVGWGEWGGCAGKARGQSGQPWGRGGLTYLRVIGEPAAPNRSR